MSNKSFYFSFFLYTILLPFSVAKGGAENAQMWTLRGLWWCMCPGEGIQGRYRHWRRKILLPSWRMWKRTQGCLLGCRAWPDASERNFPRILGSRGQGVKTTPLRCNTNEILSVSRFFFIKKICVFDFYIFLIINTITEFLRRSSWMQYCTWNSLLVFA